MIGFAERQFVGAYDVWFLIVLGVIGAGMGTAVYTLYRLVDGIVRAYLAQNK